MRVEIERIIAENIGEKSFRLDLLRAIADMCINPIGDNGSDMKFCHKCNEHFYHPGRDYLKTNIDGTDYAVCSKCVRDSILSEVVAGKCICSFYGVSCSAFGSDIDFLYNTRSEKCVNCCKD